jgi:uncharacterized Zn finger protein (UPF0148 family)
MKGHTMTTTTCPYCTHTWPNRVKAPKRCINPRCQRWLVEMPAPNSGRRSKEGN